jgi:transposase
MTINFDPNKILSRSEREERVLDLHFNQNKNYRQIAKEMKMSVRDIGEIVNKAKQEKERQEHKSIQVQAYELFSKCKTPLEVAIILNVREAQASAYYWEYLRLIQLDDITKIYQEVGSGVWDFVKLCKEAKAANIGVSQVINLLNIANNELSSVQHRYEMLQEHNNKFDSIIKTKSQELQHLNSK